MTVTVSHTAISILRQIKIVLDIPQRAHVRSSNNTGHFISIRVNDGLGDLTVNDNITEQPHPSVEADER
jgi:hypothetical protein